MTAENSTQTGTGMLMVLPTARSTPALESVIRSPHDKAAAARRLNIVLGLYFEPEQDQRMRAEVRREFLAALEPFPDWAVQAAFDKWVASATRRPTPGEIVILIHRELKPIADELAARKRRHNDEEAERNAREAARVKPEAASDLMRHAGFTPKRFEDMAHAPMATTFAEAEARKAEAAQGHWANNAPPDSPAMAQLRAARDASPAVQQARAAQAREGRT